MAQKKAAEESKDLLSRLRDAGEEALQKVAEVPGGKRALDALNGLRDRVDELQHRVTRVDELEKRIAALERKVEQAAKKPAPRRSSTASKKTSGTASKKT
jgi:predicted dinucleotide-utilizing enzyme